MAAAGRDARGKLVTEAFRRFDTNGDGIIERSELVQVLMQLDDKKKFDEKTVDGMLASMDQNGDGKIQYAEFVAWVMKSVPSIPESSVRGLSLNPRALLPERFEVDINTRYKLDKLTVGEGGYGTVCLAWDTKSGRQVAVKKVTKREGDQARTETFHREIALMKELDHPSICKLLETFESGPHIFFVMECCEGGEVFDRIIDNGFVSEAITADIIRQLASAVRYAHGRKICHRDLKPENLVFLTKDKGDNRIKLIDWGLSIGFADGKIMRSSVGSMTYTAPEVMTAMEVNAYTEACDLWSLGVVAYVMLAGKPPFWGGEKNHLQCAREERYPMDYAPWPTVSNEARDFIKRLLKAEPAMRMSIEDACNHPWLTSNVYSEDSAAQAAVLQNMKHFSNAGIFTALCITSVARQLDHKRLQGIHQVFRAMDKNGDGYLCIDEVREGFKAVHGEDSDEYREIERTFKGLDLDASGIIDYTEFCAAGMGQHTAVQEESIWAAFKTFDIDNTDTISAAELKRVLANADVNNVWSQQVCARVAGKLMAKHDANGDGVVDFKEFMGVMREAWADNLPENENANSNANANLEASSSGWVYSMLLEVSKLPVS